MNPFESLKGRTAIVTGALSGIGEASAVCLGSAGMNVVLADFSEERAEEVIQKVKSAGGEAIYVHCDVTNESDVADTVKAALDHFGKLHALVNCAGIGSQVTPLHKITTEYFDRICSVNLRGTFMMMKYGIEGMLKSSAENCSIVNIASYSGIMASSGATAYTVSKFGVIGLTKNGAADYAKNGIRVNAICPYVVKTGFLKGVPEEVIKGYEATCANGRASEPEEIAAAVLFLVSDLASYVNGVTLPVDAGKTVGDIFPLTWEE